MAGIPRYLRRLRRPIYNSFERTTIIFAEKFYQLVQDGASYPAALKAAQLYVKNMTRKDALAILSRHIANQDPQLAADKANDVLNEADTNLKSLTKGNKRQGDFVPETGPSALLDGTDAQSDDDKVFADPKYWAPFVLIGDPHARRS